jgi:hypothetical protein
MKNVWKERYVRKERNKLHIKEGSGKERNREINKYHPKKIFQYVVGLFLIFLKPFYLMTFI